MSIIYVFLTIFKIGLMEVNKRKMWMINDKLNVAGEVGNPSDHSTH
jgi:hypothetical protein